MHSSFYLQRWVPDPSHLHTESTAGFPPPKCPRAPAVSSECGAASALDIRASRTCLVLSAHRSPVQPLSACLLAKPPKVTGYKDDKATPENVMAPCCSTPLTATDLPPPAGPLRLRGPRQLAHPPPWAQWLSPTRWPRPVHPALPPPSVRAATPLSSPTSAHQRTRCHEARWTHGAFDKRFLFEQVDEDQPHRPHRCPRTPKPAQLPPCTAPALGYNTGGGPGTPLACQELQEDKH